MDNDLPPLRNQGEYGTCWAHAMIGAVEINLVKKGLVNPKTINLSEAALAYFVDNFSNDPLGNLEDESEFTDRYIYSKGGSVIHNNSTYTKWIGLVDESKAPYPENGKEKITIHYPDGDRESRVLGRLDSDVPYPDKDLMYASEYHVKNIYYVNWEQTEVVKQMLYQYGAAVWNYNNGASFNRENNCLYTPYASEPNHSILIVGYDDTYPASNFTPVNGQKPSRDGAFLMRNSWYSQYGDDSRKFSEDGYFWVSYDTKIYDNYVFFYDAIPAEDDYDNNYQYDGGTRTLAWDSVPAHGQVANVFTAKADAKGEYLKAVSFALSANSNVDYTIQIYKNVVGSDSPVAGAEYTPARTTGRTGAAGYMTIPLAAPVPLASGEKYSVVITFDTADGTSVNLEYDTDEDEPCGDSTCWRDSNCIQFDSAFGEYLNKGYWKYTSRLGQSFRYRTYNESNYGWNTTPGQVYRIKAFTDNRSGSENLPDITALDWVDDLSSGVYLCINRTYTPAYRVTPVDANPEVKWTSSKTSVATVSNGVITAKGAGSATITVSSVKNPNIKASFVITVDDGYQVTFHGNGGTTSTGATEYNRVFKYDQHANLPAMDFLKTGYQKATSWNSKADGTGTSYVPGGDIYNLEDKDLYAIHGTRQKLVLLLDANGGTINGSPTLKLNKPAGYVHESVIGDLILSYVPTRSGCTFLGWYDKAVGGNKVTSSTVGYCAANHSSASFSYDMRFYAHWSGQAAEITTCRVYFNANGGTVNPAYKDVTPGDDYGDLPVPVKEGFSFSGWYTKLSRGNRVTADTRVTQKTSHTLYAIWEPYHYYVKYDGNNATRGTMATVKVVMGQNYSIAGCGYTRNGYLFTGWGLKPVEDDRIYKPREKVQDLTLVDDATVTFYAQWTPITYTVKFAGNNGNKREIMDSIVTTYDETLLLPSNTFTRPGYTFRNWRSTTKIDGVYQDFDENESVTSNWVLKNKGAITLKAVWEYSYSLDPNGGTGAPLTRTEVEADTKITLPANTYTRVGYTFSGWALTPAGKVKYKNLASATNLADKTLYAVWTPKKYAVKYVDASLKATSTVTGRQFTLPTAVKAGYGLKEWWIQNPETGKTLKVSPGEKVDISSSFVGDYVAENAITITARWEDLSIDLAGINASVGDVVNLNSLLNYPMVGTKGYGVLLGDKTLMKVKGKKTPAEYIMLKEGDTTLQIYWTVGRQRYTLNCPVHIH